MNKEKQLKKLDKIKDEIQQALIHSNIEKVDAHITIALSKIEGLKVMIEQPDQEVHKLKDQVKQLEFELRDKTNEAK